MARRGRILRYFSYALLLAVAALGAFALHLDVRVRNEFEGRRFALPARIYARPLARLEPLPIGGIYPAGNEDRVLVRLADVPKHLVDALIATEDRKFFSHMGFDPRAVARAATS